MGQDQSVESVAHPAEPSRARRLIPAAYDLEAPSPLDCSQTPSHTRQASLGSDTVSNGLQKATLEIASGPCSAGLSPGEAGDYNRQWETSEAKRRRLSSQPPKNLARKASGREVSSLSDVQDRIAAFKLKYVRKPSDQAVQSSPSESLATAKGRLRSSPLKGVSPHRPDSQEQPEDMADLSDASMSLDSSEAEDEGGIDSVDAKNPSSLILVPPSLSRSTSIVHQLPQSATSLPESSAIDLVSETKKRKDMRLQSPKPHPASAAEVEEGEARSHHVESSRQSVDDALSGPIVAAPEPPVAKVRECLKDNTKESPARTKRTTESPQKAVSHLKCSNCGKNILRGPLCSACQKPADPGPPPMSVTQLIWSHPLEMATMKSKRSLPLKRAGDDIINQPLMPPKKRVSVKRASQLRTPETAHTSPKRSEAGARRSDSVGSDHQLKSSAESSPLSQHLKEMRQANSMQKLALQNYASKCQHLELELQRLSRGLHERDELLIARDAEAQRTKEDLKSRDEQIMALFREVDTRQQALRNYDGDFASRSRTLDEELQKTSEALYEKSRLLQAEMSRSRKLQQSLQERDGDAREIVRELNHRARVQRVDAERGHRVAQAKISELEEALAAARLRHVETDHHHAASEGVDRGDSSMPDVKQATHDLVESKSTGEEDWVDRVLSTPKPQYPASDTMSSSTQMNLEFVALDLDEAYPDLRPIPDVSEDDSEEMAVLRTREERALAGSRSAARLTESEVRTREDEFAMASSVGAFAAQSPDGDGRTSKTRRGRHRPSAADVTSEEAPSPQPSFEELMLFPKDPMPIMHDKKLAFRDGTPAPNGRLPRAKHLFYVGRDKPRGP